jgi:copper transport protein
MRHLVILLVAPVVLLASACGTTGPSPAAPATDRQSTAASVVAPSPALPQPGDLTLAHEAGSVLVGLSVRPALPGPNTVLLYVAPLAGPSAALDVPLALDVNGSSTPLTTCSRTCRSATVDLAGGDHLDVKVDGLDGGSAAFDLPALPAADGSELFQQVQDRMHDLRSYRVDEQLGPAEPLQTATYAFQAPDRMRVDLGNGSSTIWAGLTRYTLAAGAATWQSQPAGAAPVVPGFEWDPRVAGADAQPARIVGLATVDGADTRVLAFFAGTPQTPVWYQLWVDRDGLVRRAEMRAQGHFMTHRYSDFDAPLSVEAPQ